MSYRKFDNGTLFNLTLEKCVRAEQANGSNIGGATMRVADFLGISPPTVRCRIEGKVTGAPRKAGLLARAFQYLDDLMVRRQAHDVALARDIDALRQLASPFEGETNGPDQKRDARAEKHLLAADRALARSARAAGDYRKERAKVKGK